MKRYAYILTILALLVAFNNCRSSRSLSESRKEITSETIKEQNTTSEQEKSTESSTLDQTVVENSLSHEQSGSVAEKETATDEYETERTKATFYGEDGKPKLVIETERERGRTDKTNERAGSFHASGESRSDTTATRMETHSEANIDKTSETDKEASFDNNLNVEKNESTDSDSRWIQGWEWLAVIIPIAMIAGIVYLIRNGRKKNNSDSSY